MFVAPAITLPQDYGIETGHIGDLLGAFYAEVAFDLFQAPAVAQLVCCPTQVDVSGR